MAITVYYKTVGVAAYGISNPVGARLYYCSNQRVQVTDEKTTNELYGPQDATQVRSDISIASAFRSSTYYFFTCTVQ